jgi:hypothetical protein
MTAAPRSRLAPRSQSHTTVAPGSSMDGPEVDLLIEAPWLDDLAEEAEEQGAVPQQSYYRPGATPEVLREVARFAVEHAVLAPSSHNSQPWLFRTDGADIDLYADRSRALPVVDPDDRELTISCGAALLHLRLAVRHLGFADHVRLLPDDGDPDLLARVTIGERAEPSPEDEALFQTIPLRRTNRAAFEPATVPEATLLALCAAARDEGAWLKILRSEERRHALTRLIAEADQEQWGSVAFRRELASWLHPLRRHDGLGGYALGAGPLIVRTFDMGKGRAARDHQLAEGSPVLAVIQTENDLPADWLMAGQALARVLLRARGEELWASFLNQPIEVHSLRPRLREMLGGTDIPQLILRMGYGPEPKASPRRPVQQVLI